VTLAALSSEQNVTESWNFLISTRRVKETESGHFFLVMTPKRHFSVTSYNFFLLFAILAALVPPCTIGLLKCYQFRHLRKRQKLRHQSLEEVVQKNLKQHSQYVPATVAGRMSVVNNRMATQDNKLNMSQKS